MRRFCVVAIAIAMLVGVPWGAIPASAWELEMTGSMYWLYEYYTQRGANGFFGPYNVDRGANTLTANLNFWWNGPRLSQNLVTGSEASKSYFYVVLEPELKINPAVRLKGRYRLAQWNNPQASYYYTQDMPGTDNAFTQGQWTMFWASAATPWGTVGAGKRPWKFGTGLQYDGSDGLTTESLALSVPYGPLDLGLAFYPMRPARPTYGLPNSSNTLSSNSFFGLAPTAQLDPYDNVAPPYFNTSDKSGAMIADLIGYVVYNGGPLQMGVLAAGSKYHLGPESPSLEFWGRAPFPFAQDSSFFHGTVFTKYNNGRFFFNAEAAWLYWTDKMLGEGAFGAVPDPTVTINQLHAGYTSVLPGQRYTEQWRAMVEMGAMCGPAKLSLISAWTPGPDRRNGALIDKQPAAFVWHPGYDLFLGNFDVFRPYSWLFTYNYGSGINGYNLSLDGYLRDAWVLGGRMDYAVAANLNVYGTFLWAERTSNGYGWACIAPNDLFLPGQFSNGSAGDGNVQFAINGAIGSPNIPDRALGWEVDAGADWALLEGWTMGLVAAYWQPGKWFSYACIDRSQPAWNAPNAGNFWGTRPTKKIDPIFGGQVILTYSF
jgi:hypothetical protein